MCAKTYRNWARFDEVIRKKFGAVFLPHMDTLQLGLLVLALSVYYYWCTDLVKSVAWSWSGSCPRMLTSQWANWVNAALASMPTVVPFNQLSSMNRDAFAFYTHYHSSSSTEHYSHFYTSQYGWQKSVAAPADWHWQTVCARDVQHLMCKFWKVIIIVWFFWLQSPPWMQT